MNMTCDIINTVEVTSRFVLPEYNSPRERLVSSTNTMANSWAIIFGAVMNKRCFKCGEIKPDTEFYKVAAAKDGLHSWCASCNSLYVKSRLPYKPSYMAKMDGTKTCTKCKIEKPITEFYGNKRNRDGRTSSCKQCDAQIKLLRPTREPRMEGFKICFRCKENKSVLLFGVDKRAADGRQSICRKCAAFTQRKSKYRTKFGLSLEEYERIASRQSNVCSICGVSRYSLPKDLVVDHNHKNGQIRGLLCDTCNRAIGMLKDNREILLKAANYLLEDEEE